MPDKSPLHEIKLIDLVIVVLCGNRDINILNPEFLTINQILPAGLQVSREESISSPAHSRIKYREGLTVTLDINRLMVAQSMENDSGDADIFAPNVTARLLAAIPPMRYDAIGINATAAASGVSEADHRRLIQEGPWLSCGEKPPLCRAGFTYDLQDKVLSVDVRTPIRRDQGKDSGTNSIQIHGNFHYDLAANSEAKEFVLDLLADGWKRDLAEFKQLAINWSNDLRSKNTANAKTQ